MTDKERIDRLERLVTDLSLALYRRETYGANAPSWVPPFAREMGRIGSELQAEQPAEG